MDRLEKLTKWYESLHGEGGYRWLDIVRIGKDRELAFAYSFDRDSSALVEITGGKRRKLHWVHIVEDTEELQVALVDFAYGDIGPEQPLDVWPLPDRAGFTICNQFSISMLEYLGFGYASDSEEFALVHYTAARTHVIPIEYAYDTDELNNAFVRFACDEYRQLNAYIKAYNDRIDEEDLYGYRVDRSGFSHPLQTRESRQVARYPNLHLPTSKDFD